MTRKIAAGLFISLDGVVSSPNDWAFQFADDRMWEGIAAGIAEADAVLVGTGTYRSFAEIWPSQGTDGPMATFLNTSPKYVASSTLTELPWGPATLLQGDLADALAPVKELPGKNIQVPGSPRLVRSLLRDGLLDELSLSVCPIVVGSGLRLFDELPDALRLELVTSTAFGTGALGVTYRPVVAQA